MTVATGRRPGRPRRSKAWAEYAHGTGVDYFAWWTSEQLVQSVDRFAGVPLKLEGWQLDFFSEALAVDTAGRPYWRQVILVVPRKNGKTMMLGAYGLFHLLEDDGAPEVLLAASSDKQAGRLFDTTVSFVRRQEVLAEALHLREYIGEIARVDGRGKILRMASDPGRAHGYNPSLVIADELHAWTTPGLRRAWGAFVTAGGARESSQVFAITTAGDAQDRESSILGQMIDRNEAGGFDAPHDALRVSRNHEARTIIFNYSAPTVDRRDVKALKRANPASWITPAYLREQAESPTLSDAEVLQLHGCVWAESASSWLPAGAWDACADPERVVADGERIVLGFDGSASNDSTALIGCTVGDEHPHLFVLGCWERPSTRHEWKVPRLEVDAAVRAACRRYDVAEFAADPPLWRSELEVWEQEIEGVGEWVAYDTRQLSIMGDACSGLYSAVVEGRVSHDGSDVLARHVANCKGKDTRWGMVVTKPKNSPHKIDAAVAAIAAHDRAVAVGADGGGYVIRLYGEDAA